MAEHKKQCDAEKPLLYVAANWHVMRAIYVTSTAVVMRFCAIVADAS